jgi:hypothetical protein
MQAHANSPATVHSPPFSYRPTLLPACLAPPRHPPLQLALRLGGRNAVGIAALLCTCYLFLLRLLQSGVSFARVPAQCPRPRRASFAFAVHRTSKYTACCVLRVACCVLRVRAPYTRKMASKLLVWLSHLLKQSSRHFLRRALPPKIPVLFSLWCVFTSRAVEWNRESRGRKHRAPSLSSSSSPFGNKSFRPSLCIVQMSFSSFSF